MLVPDVAAEDVGCESPAISADAVVMSEDSGS